MSDHIPSLQEEVNRKAFDSVAELIGLLESGSLSPAQANLVLNVLQTAFNGIVTDGDFCGVLTELSMNLFSYLPFNHALKLTLRNDCNQEMHMMIEGAKVTVDHSGKTFDTPKEAYDSAVSVVNKLSIAGFKPARS